MNIIVKNKFIQLTDKETLFLDEDVTYVDDTLDLPNLCVKLGVYKSTSQARGANRKGAIPTGFTEMKLNKKTPAWIWNPTE